MVLVSDLGNHAHDFVTWQGCASGNKGKIAIYKVRRGVTSLEFKRLLRSRPRTRGSLRVPRRRQQVVKRHCLCDNHVSGVGTVSPRPLKSFAWPKFGLYRLLAWLSIVAYLSLGTYLIFVTGAGVNLYRFNAKNWQFTV